MGFSGAQVRRVIDPAFARVPEHAHDWPLLSLFVVGQYQNVCEDGAADINAPSAVLYRPGAAHANAVAQNGFEQIEIEFDPAWLGSGMLLPDRPVTRWIGGPAGARARQLALLLARSDDETAVRQAMRDFVAFALARPQRPPPRWLARVDASLRKEPGRSVQGIAADLDMHPGWLGQSYKSAKGEGLRQTATRLRVEIATRLLRETDEACAEIAAEAGFCDQSHMIRCFRRTLDRLPGAVRDDRALFRRF